MLLGIIFGIAIGVLSMGLVCRAKSAGTLMIVDPSEYEKDEPPYLFIEISKPDELMNGNYISVYVKRKKPRPQK